MHRLIQKIVLRALGPLKGLGLRRFALVRATLGALKPNVAIVRGRKFYLDATDFSVSEEVSAGGYEAAEIEIVEKLVRPTDAIVDVGANIGYYSAYFCELAPNGHVIAFEPNARTFRILQKNMETRGYTNIELHNAGLGERSGDGTLYVNQYNKGDNRAYPSFGAVGVPFTMTALDDVVPTGTAVDLIKIDIQGYEVYAFRGMKRVFSESLNLKMLVECSPKLLRKANTSVQEFFSLLEENKFSWMLINSEQGTLVPIQKEEYIKRFSDEEDAYGNLFCWKGERPAL